MEVMQVLFEHSFNFVNIFFLIAYLLKLSLEFIKALYSESLVRLYTVVYMYMYVHEA